MILLDTCAIIWCALKPDKLSPDAKRAIESHNRDLVICDISLWEIAMLIKKGRLGVDDTISGFIGLVIQSQNYSVRPITPEIAESAVNLGSGISNDPADRLIAATSILLNAPIVTADKNLREAGFLNTIW